MWPPIYFIVVIKSMSPTEMKDVGLFGSFLVLEGTFSTHEPLK